jgi:choline/ethanolamine kinase
LKSFNKNKRIYGESHQKHRGTLLIDSVVCTLLSERKLGPHVYGIFPEGRLEQFVDVRLIEFLCEIE